MPVMNGAEFLRRKALDSKFAGVPVVVMSAEKSRLVGEGVAGFLAKPFNVACLLDTVERFTAEAASRQPALGHA